MRMPAGHGLLGSDPEFNFRLAADLVAGKSFEFYLPVCSNKANSVFVRLQ